MVLQSNLKLKWLGLTLMCFVFYRTMLTLTINHHLTILTKMNSHRRSMAMIQLLNQLGTTEVHYWLPCSSKCARTGGEFFQLGAQGLKEQNTPIQKSQTNISRGFPFCNRRDFILFAIGCFRSQFFIFVSRNRSFYKGNKSGVNLSCTRCGKQYVGQTMLRLKNRFVHHFRDIELADVEKKSVSQHFSQINHNGIKEVQISILEFIKKTARSPWQSSLGIGWRSTGHTCSVAWHQLASILRTAKHLGLRGNNTPTVAHHGASGPTSYTHIRVETLELNYIHSLIHQYLH